MTSNVTDANVWVALLTEQHAHHAIARHWYRSLQPEEAGLTRSIQLAVIRLLGTHAVEALLEDERVEFLHEPPGLDRILPSLLRYRQPTPNLVNDAYLAAFAIASERKLVTFDRGFLEFPGLAVEILA